LPAGDEGGDTEEVRGADIHDEERLGDARALRARSETPIMLAVRRLEMNDLKGVAAE